MEITLALGAELLLSAGIDRDAAAAASRLRRSLESGEAAGALRPHGAHCWAGPRISSPITLAICSRHRIVRPVFADVEGPVSAIRTRDLGLAVIELGGGRRVAADRIDHRVGLSALLGKGDIADRARPLCRVHAADDASFAKARRL